MTLDMEALDMIAKIEGQGRHSMDQQLLIFVGNQLVEAAWFQTTRIQQRAYASLGPAPLWWYAHLGDDAHVEASDMTNSVKVD